MSHFLITLLYTLFAVALCAGAAGAIVLFLTVRKLKQIKLAPNASFFDALRAVPLSLVVGLDLLDLGFDFFAAPITWVLLERTGLSQLRNVAVIESLIPGTQMLPTMTLAWVVARLIPPDLEPTWLGGKGPGTRPYRTIDAEFRAAR